MEPRYFRSPAEARAWLAEHHATEQELLVGFFKVGSGTKGITYPEMLDEALCFGWIDAIRRSLDEARYTIRFTPRRKGSIWSAVNLRHVARLKREGRMAPAGLAAFEGRDRAKVNRYSFENKPRRLPPAFAARLKADAKAWAWWSRAPPSYRRTATFWVTQGKQEATRERRFAELLACSARGVKVKPLRRTGEPA